MALLILAVADETRPWLPDLPVKPYILKVPLSFIPSQDGGNKQLLIQSHVITNPQPSCILSTLYSIYYIGSEMINGSQEQDKAQYSLKVARFFALLPFVLCYQKLCTIHQTSPLEIITFISVCILI